MLVALGACTIGAVTGIAGGMRHSGSANKWSRWMAYLVGVAVSVAMVLMEYALLTHDF